MGENNSKRLESAIDNSYFLPERLIEFSGEFIWKSLPIHYNSRIKWTAAGVLYSPLFQF